MKRDDDEVEKDMLVDIYPLNLMHPEERIYCLGQNRFARRALPLLICQLD
jgi:hypothetical protein